MPSVDPKFHEKLDRMPATATSFAYFIKMGEVPTWIGTHHLFQKRWNPQEQKDEVTPRCIVGHLFAETSLTSFVKNQEDLLIMGRDPADVLKAILRPPNWYHLPDQIRAGLGTVSYENDNYFGEGDESGSSSSLAGSLTRLAGSFEWWKKGGYQYLCVECFKIPCVCLPSRKANRK